MLKLLSSLKINPIVEPLKTDKDFLTISSLFQHQFGTVILLSGTDLDCARYNLLAINPVLFIKAKGKKIVVQTKGKKAELFNDPFDLLKPLLKELSIKDVFDDIPVITGLFGYFSYDLKDHIERLPKTSIDDLNLPDLLLFLPGAIVIEDRFKNRLFLCCVNHEERERFKNMLSTPLKESEEDFFVFGDLKSNFTYSSYIEAIEKIKNYIIEGHVYQVNLSQRFSVNFSGSPFLLFKKLFYKNPAPFYAYINAKDHFVISTSPERFLYKNGNYVETRPIKGTRPRGKTKEEDERYKKELLNSSKDDAELSMIVDLLRNDLGKVCKAKSVKVKEHKRLERYDNVYHLISIVVGELEEGKDEVDLLRATFPGGSITGCPKVRAMEIIDELEPNRRHIYTGSIGYISFHNTMDLSIAIRTATLVKNSLFFSVGGGIVFDSDPKLEYEETIHKGKTFIQVLGERKRDKKYRYVWFNGSLTKDEEAKVEIDSLGFSYGYGFFETIRAKNGKIYFLEDHIKRFNKTWKDFFDISPPEISWEDVILQVLEKNNLLKSQARVKIIASKNKESELWNYILCVSAYPYTHRLKQINQKGLKLITYPYPRQTPLADHKSLNYLYYFLAGKWAKKQGKDEALILNPDGSISETNSANIFFVNHKTKELIIPLSPHVLSGVMLKNVCEFLEKRGYVIEKRKIFTNQLNSDFKPYISNSLIGVVFVLEIDNIKFQFDEQDIEFAKWLNLSLIDENIP